MNFKLLKAIMITGIVAFSIPTWSQNTYSLRTEQNQNINEGHFFINLRAKNVSTQKVEKSLTSMLGLKGKSHLKKWKQTTDRLGYSHVFYKQYFNHILVENTLIAVHSKNGKVTTVNGVAYKIPNTFMTGSPSISANSAIATAKANLGIKQIIRSYTPKLVISKTKSSKKDKFLLAWDIRIDGWNNEGQITMTRLFINATTGKVIKAYPLIADANTEATAETLYRGEKTIIVDSVAPHKYFLRDSSRKVYTFNAGGLQGNAQNQNATAPFDTNVDYTNSSHYWGQIIALTSYSVDTIGISGFLNHGNVLVTAVGHGHPVADINADNYLNTNPTFPVPNAPPVTQTGMQIQIEDDSLFGALLMIQFQGFSSINIKDSLFFFMTDTTIGTHHWHNSDGGGNYTIDSTKNPALDAHWGMEETHDYYLDVFNRNSYDGNGSEIKNYVNGMVAFGGTQDNAAALPDPYNSMVYGLGDGQTMGPVVGLDVMGHEFTHMVTAHNSYGGLNYQDESGALNESFSDMMGTAIEFYADSSEADWTIGEQVMLQAPGYMRSMKKPKGPSNVSQSFTRQPNTYKGQYWYTGNQDNGGVHINSGVSNKWFCLLSIGGNGTNDNNYSYDISGIGIDKARQIAYRGFTQYLNQDATFMDAYHGTLTAATDLFGENSTEYATVKEAWRAVGIPANQQGINPVVVQNNGIYVFPNPAKNKVTISSSLNTAVKMVLYNVSGEKVRVLKVAPGEKIINISNLSRGTYFLKYNLNNNNESTKLTVY